MIHQLCYIAFLGTFIAGVTQSHDHQVAAWLFIAAVFAGWLAHVTERKR